MAARSTGPQAGSGLGLAWSSVGWGVGTCATWSLGPLHHGSSENLTPDHMHVGRSGRAAGDMCPSSLLTGWARLHRHLTSGQPPSISRSPSSPDSTARSPSAAGTSSGTAWAQERVAHLLGEGSEPVPLLPARHPAAPADPARAGDRGREDKPLTGTPCRGPRARVLTPEDAERQKPRGRAARG